jgi:DNA primase
VVEGFFDCMKVYQAGVRSVIGLMGAALYEPQRDALLEKFRHIILLLDGDATGRSTMRAGRYTLSAWQRRLDSSSHPEERRGSVPTQ